MRRRVHGRAFLVGASALAVACSLPDVDLTGRRCPCDDGFVCDPATQRCVLPSSLDASAAGDAPGIDGGPEVGAPDAAAGSFCATLVPAPDFCADFDTADLCAAWSCASGNRPVSYVPRTLELDSTLSRSAPRAVRVWSPALAAGDTRYAYLPYEFARAVDKELVVDFDLLVVKRSTRAGQPPASILTMGLFGATSRDVVLQIVGGGDLRIEGSAPTMALPATGRWAHLTWTYSRTAGSAVLEQREEGADAGTTVYAGAPTAAYQRVQLKLGINYLAGPADEIELRLDNVVVRFR